MDAPRIQADWYPDKLRQKEAEALRARRRAGKLATALPDIPSLGARAPARESAVKIRAACARAPRWRLC